MKKTNLLVIAFAVIATGCSAIAADEKKAGGGMMGHGMMGQGMMGQGMMGQGMMGQGMMGQGMMGNMMKKMDANSDGMLSKDEFMKGHEQMFDMMKNKDGVVAINDMPMKCMDMMMGGENMMDGGKMMDGGHMMQRGMGQANR
jgi:hypothetical protein